MRCAYLLTHLLLSALIHPPPVLPLFDPTRLKQILSFRNWSTSPELPPPKKKYPMQGAHQGKNRVTHRTDSDQILSGLPSAPELKEIGRAALDDGGGRRTEQIQ